MRNLETLTIPTPRQLAVAATAALPAAAAFTLAAADGGVTERGIRDAVDDELFFGRSVPHHRLEVAVAVSDGVVTLTGTVDSWMERAAATQNAYEGGAAYVDNDLEVE